MVPKSDRIDKFKDPKINSFNFPLTFSTASQWEVV
jgi:hypothetical protein